MPNDRRAIGRNPCHERNLFKNPFGKEKKIVYNLGEKNFFFLLNILKLIFSHRCKE
jgi:hypothetical protein